MGFFGFLSSLPGALAVFLVSLLIVIAASAQFTRKVEELCDALQLSSGLLSLLSAIGANIPNYVSSALAILAGQIAVGIGIIVGSNIYALAMILGLCTFFSPQRSGLTLERLEQQEVRVIVIYTVVITLLASLLLCWLPGEPFLSSIHTLPLYTLPLTRLLLLLTAVGEVSFFIALLVHLFRRAHAKEGGTLHHHAYPRQKTPWSMPRLVGENIFTLAVALGGVLVMVQSGQTLTTHLHLPSVLAGLLVLAVATSLPNTVVAISLVRTGETAACLEELCSSGNINLTLGLVLPLCLWPGLLGDRFLLFVDTPLLLALTIATFFWIGVGRGGISRRTGALLLGSYVAWVLLRLWL